VDKDKVTFLSKDEALNIGGSGLGCWISTGAAAVSLSLLCFNMYAISTVGMLFYC